MVTNHNAMIGPNAAPMREVPSGCTANSAEQNDDGGRHHIVVNAGAAILRPSSADSTEIAGVIAPSP